MLLKLFILHYHKNIIAITILLISSCTMRMPPDFYRSPSGKYQLKVDLNRIKSDKNNNCVLLTICDSAYKELSRLQTNASNTMKWAVGWHSTYDTVILNSKDIGLYAYEISDSGRFISISLNQDLEIQASAIFKKKYLNKN